MPILKEVIIDLPADPNDINPRVLENFPWLQTELCDILPKINDVVCRGCPKLHLAVTYLANLCFSKYGVKAECQTDYSEGNHDCSGIVLVLDLHPDINQVLVKQQDPFLQVAPMPQHYPTKSLPQQSPKSSAKFVARLGRLLKPNRPTSSRFGSELPSLEAFEAAEDSQSQGNLRSHDMPPLLVNNLVC